MNSCPSHIVVAGVLFLPMACKTNPIESHYSFSGGLTTDNVEHDHNILGSFIAPESIELITTNQGEEKPRRCLIDI